jgi:tripartite-type tricarboxylate transporter receptor subunit TctC
MLGIARRSLLIGSLAAVAAPARAQAWPSKPVKIVVPFGPGGPADVYARQIGNELAEVLKQQFVIENKTGAGGTIGADIVAKAAPDGYTLLMMSNTHTTNETLLATRPYSLMKDLAAVAPVNSSDLVIVVNPAVKAKTLQEFIALAKAEPGKLNYASSGPGTPYHIVGEIFLAMAGLQVQHIPFRGSGEARNAVVAGQVQWMFDAIPTMAQQIRSGQVRGLATTGPKRSTLLPELPTVAETLPGFDGPIWIGLMAPAGTPADIIERMNREVTRAMTTPAAREWQAKLGSEPMPMSASEFSEHIRKDVEVQRKWITQAGIKVN